MWNNVIFPINSLYFSSTAQNLYQKRKEIFQKSPEAFKAQRWPSTLHQKWTN